MNNKFTIALWALALTLLAGCAKDEAPATTTALQQNQVPSDMQAIADKALAEIEYDYNHPPGGTEIGSRATVTVPAGSVNALAAAIAQAGPNGKVVLKSGSHWESNTVTITQKVTIQGEEGAKLYVDVAGPGDPFPFLTTNVLDPAILIKDCNFVWIKNLEIRPQGAKGSTGIFLEKGRFARIEGNLIKNFQFGIWLSDNSNTASLYDNEVVGYSDLGVWGLVMESGKSVKLKGNYVASFASNIFASDERGIATDNEMEGGFQGILLCTVQGNVQLPNGTLLQNAIPCKDWKVMNNYSHHNYWNYLVIDGANHNFLFRNDAANAGLYDIELTGETSRFGALSPTSSYNFVVNLNNSIINKDCGIGNTILGGTLVDNAVDPCF